MANSTMSATARELTASLRQTNRLLVASLTTKWQVSLSASILGILVVTLGLVFGPFGLGVSMSQGVTSLMRPAVQAAPSAGVILPKLDCASLAPPPNLSVGSVDFTGIPGAPTRIQSASVVLASEQNPEYCDIKGYVDGQNQFELKLPTKTWQGRYLQFGCGGYCGFISKTTFPPCDLQPGGDFATAATNMGHNTTTLSDGLWAADDPQMRIDFGYRAEHVLALASKAIIAAFYGVGPAHSYFQGCSDGGREALMEAERYPTDFNGIIVGAPASFVAQNNAIWHLWNLKVNRDEHGNEILTPDKLPALHAAVMAACDGNDGLVDGQISNPLNCHFDPASIRCPAGTDQPTCLTAAQVEVVKKVYNGPVDAQGRRLYLGGMPYGSELKWSGEMVVTPSTPIPAVPAYQWPENWLRFMGFPLGQPTSSVESFQFTVKDFNRLRAMSSVYNSTNADLTAFRNHGGKLILWQGWADQGIPPIATVAYYDAVLDRMGQLTAVQKFARLFMFPSMYHCSTGYGPDMFDTINPMVHWVEKSEAPSRIIATQTDTDTPSGKVIRTRPVFPWPEETKYKGSGSINDAANFVGVLPSPLPDIDIDWVGNDLFNAPEAD
jgi:Tannase and feruloyl esterase